MTRRRTAILTLLSVLAAAGVWRGEAIYWWVMTIKNPGYGSSTSGKVYIEMGGYHRFSRWSEDFQLLGETVDWYSDTGFLYTRSFYRSDGSSRRTWWNADGSIRCQMDNSVRARGSGSEYRSEPPWLWGEVDQTEPTAPWTLQGISMREWYLAE